MAQIAKAEKPADNKTEKATLKIGEKEFHLPIVVGSEGEKAIDISSLRADTGFVTLDNGYMNTGGCTSAITFLDGERGILRYRGIPIDQLADGDEVEIALAG